MVGWRTSSNLGPNIFPWAEERRWHIFLSKLMSNFIFNQGFFVEAGAFDGATDSTSLHFEIAHQWSGLLIEPVSRFLFILLSPFQGSLLRPCQSFPPYWAQGSSFQGSFSSLWATVTFYKGFLFTIELGWYTFHVSQVFRCASSFHYCRVLHNITECYRVLLSVIEYYRIFLAHLPGPIFGLVSPNFRLQNNVPHICALQFPCGLYKAL